MLPAAARLRRREEFTDVVRRGRRASRGPLTCHLAPGDATPCPQVGFVIGKVVGPAVVRNRLRRRLRHLLRARLATLPPGTRLVVRARPGAGELDSAALGSLLDAALAKLAAA
ncbi:MAG TPA: ribonuclease P protein component [Mycobacteriales bacterium]|nr:ribonuclease P protein component [Mycobacteriales bacterium]